MPYTTAMGEKYDSGDFDLFLTKTLEAADWNGFAARKAEAEKRGKLYGRGLASYVEWTSANVMNEMAHYEVKADGKVVIWMGTQGMGQGLQTSFTQLASELLGIDPSQIEIAMGDSDRVGGVGSMGSRSAYIGGSAVLSGSEKLVDKGKELAADALEAATADIVYSAGRFTITGTDRGIGLGELAAKQPDKRIYIENVNTVDGIAWPNGAHVGEVEIDPDTGMVELKRYTTVDDVGKAAKDWPQIRFVVYHSAFRWTGAPGASAGGYEQFEKTGRVDWTSDLAEIPGKYGVSNVYADLGQIFAQTTVTEPRLCAALMGMLIKGMGADHVVWGTDAVWTGAPQWQIEALRRLEIPEDMQRKFGFAPLGSADGPVKRAIFGENSAKMYKYDIKKAAW
eukprot:gene46209-57624_t